MDLNTASVKLCNQLGPDTSKALANNPKDPTHFNEKGAKTMAGLVMQDLHPTLPGINIFKGGTVRRRDLYDGDVLQSRQ